jgi:hypothetical protein
MRFSVGLECEKISIPIGGQSVELVPENGTISIPRKFVDDALIRTLAAHSVFAVPSAKPSKVPPPEPAAAKAPRLPLDGDDDE